MDQEIDVHSQSFYDDSSGAMGIGYSASGIRLSPQAAEAMREASTAPASEATCIRCHGPRKTCGCLTYDEEQLDVARRLADHEAGIVDVHYAETTNAGAHAGWAARVRELVAQGYSVVEAERTAFEEQPNVLHPDETPKTERADYLGDKVENLMRRKVKGGGGGGGSKSKEKTFPKRCKQKDCFLQYCDHRVSRGRKKKPNAAVKPIRARLTEADYHAIKSTGLTAADHMRIIAEATRTGRAYEAVKSEMFPQAA